jgi:hypothetical protein
MYIPEQPIKGPSGKSLIFFMGAGFSPFCAAEHWAIASAENFGSWEGLVETTSADHDEKHLNIPTVSFAAACLQATISSL